MQLAELASRAHTSAPRDARASEHPPRTVGFDDCRIAALTEVLERLGPTPELRDTLLASADRVIAGRAVGWWIGSAAANSTGEALWDATERRAATLYRHAAASGDVDPSNPDVITALDRCGGGHALPDDVRSDMEAELGVSLDRVRIHTDSLAARAAAAVRANAFTVGEDIFFAAGAFDPSSRTGRRLIAHELAHVMQAWSGRVRSSPGMRVSDPGDPLEHDAERLAEQVERSDRRTARAPASEIARSPAAAPTTRAILRKPDEKAPAPRYERVGGDINSKKIIRVAWTIDDGPTPVTDRMKQTLAGLPRTWYVMRDRIEAGGHTKENLAKLLEAQKQGDEIAIHGVDKTRSHLHWFPSNEKPSHASIEEALANLTAFHGQLRDAGITPRFIRLPSGEYTEMVHYLAKLGIADRTLCEKIARQIIKGEKLHVENRTATKPPDAHGKKADDEQSKKAEAERIKKAELERIENEKRAKTAKAAWDALQKGIQSNGLALLDWGGQAASVQSWEAESSMADTVTDSHEGVVHDPKKPAKQGAQRGMFELRVDRVTPEKPESLVILTHDTAKKYVDEVGRDQERMEAYAKSKHVRIEYYTMSELYDLLHPKR